MRWVLAGVAVPMCLTLLVLMAARPHRPASSEPRGSPRAARSAQITAPQADSVDLARGAARRDLAGESRRLSACGRPHARCAHLPIAHIAFGGRIAARILTAVANTLPEGRCRGLVLGSGNTLGLLSAQADELWRGIGDRSSDGRRRSLHRFAEVRGFVTVVRQMLGGPEWTTCRPGRLSVPGSA